MIKLHEKKVRNILIFIATLNLFIAPVIVFFALYGDSKLIISLILFSSFSISAFLTSCSALGLYKKIHQRTYLIAIFTMSYIPLALTSGTFAELYGIVNDSISVPLMQSPLYIVPLAILLGFFAKKDGKEATPYHTSPPLSSKKDTQTTPLRKNKNIALSILIVGALIALTVYVTK